jgi:hypothetical protein
MATRALSGRMVMNALVSSCSRLSSTLWVSSSRPRSTSLAISQSESALSPTGVPDSSLRSRSLACSFGSLRASVSHQITTCVFIRYFTA